MKNKSIKISVITLGAIVSLVFLISIAKGVRPLSWEIHNQINQGMFSGLAISGYDAVAFFTDGEAKLGSEEISLEWNDAVWKFSTQENKLLFEKSPEKYVPQFGGYCGFASGKGFTANADPTTFEIIEGKLYFFADADMKSNWMEDPTGNN
jgi:YHS domain-containing protein